VDENKEKKNKEKKKTHQNTSHSLHSASHLPAEGGCEPRGKKKQDITARLRARMCVRAYTTKKESTCARTHARAIEQREQTKRACAHARANSRKRARTRSKVKAKRERSDSILVVDVLQICCSVLRCVAVSRSALQCVAPGRGARRSRLQMCYSVLRSVAVRCSMSQCVAVCCTRERSETIQVADVLQCVVACCGALQYVAVCCSVLHQGEERGDPSCGCAGYFELYARAASPLASSRCPMLAPPGVRAGG